MVITELGGSVLILAAGCICMMLVARKWSAFERERTMEQVSVMSILADTKTNNTYPPILDILSSLESDLAKKHIILHADMKGYMSDEESDEG